MLIELLARFLIGGGYRILFLVLLAVIACVDATTRRIPNVLVLAGVGLWLTHVIAAALMPARALAFGIYPLGSYVAASLAGAFGLGAFLVLLNLLTSRFMPAGLGAGDIKLAATIGLYVGFWQGLIVLAAASILGVLWVFVRRLVRKHTDLLLHETFAFGPPLSLSAAFCLIPHAYLANIIETLLTV